MDCATHEKVTEQQLARWRREFEAARSFEPSDDEKYWPFKPVEPFKPVSDARIVSKNTKNTFPRVSALQKWEFQGHGPQPPRPPKQSLPQQYDPDKHGSWQPSDHTTMPDKPATPVPAVSAIGTEIQKRLEQRTQDPEKLTLPSAATGNFHGYLDEELWNGLQYWQKRQGYAQREQSRYVVTQKAQAAVGAEEHVGSTAHARNDSEGSGSGHSGSGESTIQQQLGAGAHYGRNGLVWKATYGGNF